MSEITVVFDDYTADATDHDTQERSEFDVNADYLAAYIKSLAPKLQQFGPEANGLAQSMNALKDAAAVAAAGQNYQGEWNDQPNGAFSKNNSVTHDNILWLATDDILAIESSEPSNSNPDWFAATIATNAPQTWTARQTFSGGTRLPWVPLSGTAPVISAGSYYWAPSGACTPVTDLADGDSCTLMLMGGTGFTVDWDSIITDVNNWLGRSKAPALSWSNYIVIVFWNKGGTVYGKY